VLGALKVKPLGGGADGPRRYYGQFTGDDGTTRFVLNLQQPLVTVGAGAVAGNLARFTWQDGRGGTRRGLGADQPGGLGADRGDPGRERSAGDGLRARRRGSEAQGAGLMFASAAGAPGGGGGGASGKGSPSVRRTVSLPFLSVANLPNW
jgi:hypothetical protein